MGIHLKPMDVRGVRAHGVGRVCQCGRICYREEGGIGTRHVIKQTNVEEIKSNY